MKKDNNETSISLVWNILCLICITVVFYSIMFVKYDMSILHILFLICAWLHLTIFIVKDIIKDIENL